MQSLLHNTVDSKLVFPFVLQKFTSQGSYPPPKESDSSELALYTCPLPETGNTKGKDQFVPHNYLVLFTGSDESINQTVHAEKYSLDLLMQTREVQQQNWNLLPVVQLFSELVEASDLQCPSVS